MGEGICNKCMGAKLITIGAIFVVNEGLNSGWVNGMSGTSPWFLAGAVMMLSGVMKLIKSTCGCKDSMSNSGNGAPSKASAAKPVKRK